MLQLISTPAMRSVLFYIVTSRHLYCYIVL